MSRLGRNAQASMAPSRGASRGQKCASLIIRYIWLTVYLPQSSSIESLWHLIIPPTMTFLDDYKAAYKLKGVRLVSVLLDSVPPDLLHRTGVGKLLATVRWHTFFRPVEFSQNYRSHSRPP